MPVGGIVQKPAQLVSDSATKPAPSASRPRSPNYPLITLERALAVAEKVYTEEKRFVVPVATVCSHAGLGGGKSGTAIRILSALKKYGVFEDDQGMMSMTEAARNYVLTPNDLDAQLAIRRHMARQYEEVTQVITQFPNGLPDDEPLKRYFVVERGFTPSGAQEFAVIIKEIVSFAKLYEGDHNNYVPQPTSQTPSSAQVIPDLASLFAPAASPSLKQGPSVNVFSVDGVTVEIRSSVPLDQMTERQLRRLIRFLQVHEENAKEDGRDQ